MKRKLISLVLSLICLLTLCTSLMASSPRVNDFANLLTLDQVEELEASLATLSETYQMEVVILTIDDAEGKSSMNYADDFYDTNGYGYGKNHDGVLLLIDMDNRNIWISTSGLSMKYLTDSRIDTILDKVFNYIADGNYYKGCKTFIENVKTAFNATPVSDNQLHMDPKDEKPFTNSYGNPLTMQDYIICGIVALIGGLIIASIVRAIVSYSYKHPKYTAPSTLPSRNSVHYSEKQDRFVSSHTTKTKDRKSTRLNSSPEIPSSMPSSA